MSELLEALRVQTDKVQRLELELAVAIRDLSRLATLLLEAELKDNVEWLGKQPVKP